MIQRSSLIFLIDLNADVITSFKYWEIPRFFAAAWNNVQNW